MLKQRQAAELDLRAVGATSTDDNHPPEHILDDNPGTFWLTTGLFPQELVLSLPCVTSISVVHVKCCNVGQLSIQSSTEEIPEQFAELVKSDFKSQVGRLQSEQFKLENAVQAKHLKLVVTKAFDHFVSLHTINITT